MYLEEKDTEQKVYNLLTLKKSNFKGLSTEQWEEYKQKKEIWKIYSKIIFFKM